MRRATGPSIQIPNLRPTTTGFPHSHMCIWQNCMTARMACLAPSHRSLPEARKLQPEIPCRAVEQATSIPGACLSILALQKPPAVVASGAYGARHLQSHPLGRSDRRLRITMQDRSRTTCLWHGPGDSSPSGRAARALCTTASLCGLRSAWVHAILVAKPSENRVMRLSFYQ